MLDAGAAYDIVDKRYFDEIVKYGLRRVIVVVLIEPGEKFSSSCATIYDGGSTDACRCVLLPDCLKYS